MCEIQSVERLPAGSKRPDRGLASEILCREQGQHSMIVTGQVEFYPNLLY